MKKRTRLAAGLLAAGLALGLCACGPEEAAAPSPEANDAQEVPSPSPSPSQEPEEAGLTLCLGEEPLSLDPTLVRRRSDAALLGHLFEGLMRWEPSGQTVGEGVYRAQLTCGQAQSYDRTEHADGTATYTFRLRPEAKWSDGKAVTAQDFVYAWQRLADPATGAVYGDMIDCVVNAADVRSGAKEPGELAVQAVDGSTFAVTVQDVPYFLELCAFPAAFPVRQDVVEQGSGQWTYSPDTIVTNGMYRLTDWTYGAQLTVEKNPQYYDPARQVAPALTFAFQDDDSLILSAYQEGRLDFALAAPAGQVPALLADGTMAAADYAGTYYLCFQTQKAPFDDPRVRQAFALAVDRSQIVEQVTGGGETEAGGYVPAGISDADGPTGRDFRAVGGDYYGPTGGDYEANCRQARELLAQAGYPGGAGFPEVTYLYNTGAHHQAVAQALAEMWQRELGVAVTLNGQEWGAFLRLRGDGDYSIARGSWTADFDDPMGFLELWRTGAPGNDARYANADFDALLSAAQAQDGAQARMELLHQAEDMLLGRDWALCPVYFYTQTYLLRPQVDGVCYTPLGYFFFNAARKG